MAKKKVEPDKHVLTVDEAIALLSPHKEGRKLRVHTFEQRGKALWGCDMDLKNIKNYIKESEDLRLSGPKMRAMGHGFAFFSSVGYIFVETDRDKIDALHKERGI
jgi:hypothetical protein